MILFTQIVTTVPVILAFIAFVVMALEFVRCIFSTFIAVLEAR